MADPGNDLYKQHPDSSITTNMIARSEDPNTSTIDLAVRVSSCAQPLLLRLYFHHDGQPDGTSGSAPPQRIDAFCLGRQSGLGKLYSWTPAPKPGRAELNDKGDDDDRCHRATINKPLPPCSNPVTLLTLLWNAANWAISPTPAAAILTLSWQAAVLVPFLNTSTAQLCLAHPQLILVLALILIWRPALARWLRRQDHLIFTALVVFGFPTAI